MAKLWKGNNPVIPWICNEDEEDFFASVGNYRLRVEQMDKGVWWWAVSYFGDQILTSLPDTTTSKYRAIGLAEGLYMGHSTFHVGNIRFFKSAVQ